MLPKYDQYLTEDSFLFPAFDSNVMKKWSVRNFFKRTLGLILYNLKLYYIILYYNFIIYK